MRNSAYGRGAELRNARGLALKSDLSRKSAMDTVHEMAAELFVRIMAARVGTDSSPQEFSGDVARDCYVYARAFFDEHGKQLGNARSPRQA